MRRATVLRFDHENPPTPPQPARAWHLAKWMFNRLYRETVPQGRIPVLDTRAGRPPPTSLPALFTFPVARIAAWR